MECILAEHAGFCFGVKRAVDFVYELLEQDTKIYTYGPIIHNEEVVNELSLKGVTVIDSPDEIATLNEGTLVIRAHGIPKSVNDIINSNKNIKCVDGTCPFVKRIHNIVAEESSKGNQIVIIGNANHPEVLGIKGWVNNDVYIVENKDEAINVSLNSEIPVCIVSQTTFNINKFKELVDIIAKRGYTVNVVNTICNATKERQESAGEIASKVDVMLVIGGRNSSNTQKLFDICKEKCPNTYYIQTTDDLSFDLPGTASKVGITAGASTPNKIIQEVQKYVRRIEF